MSNKLIKSAQNKAYCLNGNVLATKDYMSFEDRNVKTICVNNFSSDGLGLTIEDAQAVTNLSTIFNGNNYLQTFDELENFTGLTSIYGNTSDPYGAFANCTKLYSVRLPSTITSIGAYAFYNSGIEKISLPTSVTNLYQSCFNGCDKLEEVTIPGTVTTEQNVFNQCKNLKKINLTNLSNFFNCTWNATYGYPGQSGGQAELWLNGSKLTSITVPSGITTIKERALCDIKGFTSISIPSGVTSIEKYAIAGTNIQSITLPNTITRLKDGAISWNESLTSVTLPTTLTHYNGDTSVFRDCPALKTLTFFGSLNLLNSNLEWFRNCTALDTIYCSDFKQWCTILPNTTTFYANSNPFGANTLTHYVYFNNQEVTTLTVPDTMTTIPAGACYRWNRLTSVTIPSTITNIGERAFRECTSLSGDIVIPSSVNTIGSEAFCTCGNLNKITIKGTITKGGIDWFYYNTSQELVFENQPTVNSTWLNGGGKANATSVFRTSGNLTKTSANTYYIGNWAKYFIGGDLNQPYNGPIIGNSNNTEFHIAGNLNFTNASGGTLANVGGCKLAFVEVGGVVSNTKASINANNANGCINGFIWHFAKTDGIACSPTVAAASYSRVAKIYVGDGSSQANDQAVLNMYLADTDWAQYSSKLDLWYNYSGQYKV